MFVLCKRRGRLVCEGFWLDGLGRGGWEWRERKLAEWGGEGREGGGTNWNRVRGVERGREEGRDSCGYGDG